MTASATTSATAASPSQTRDARSHWHRLRPWLISVFFALAALAVTIILAISAANQSGHLLSPTSPGPNGAKALVGTLEQHGVTVTTVDSFDDATDAIAANTHQTLVVHDPAALLKPERVDELLDSGVDRIVFLNPTGARFEPLEEYVYYSGNVMDNPDDGSHEAGDDCPIGDQAPRLSMGGASAWRPAPSSPSPVAECYSTKAGNLILQFQHGASTVTVVGAYEQFTNAVIDREANAAAAINVLGAHDQLTWYVPGQADITVSNTPGYTDYLPGWITPVMLLLGSAVLATMFWRGKRLGPLVAERLPVVIPANETVSGRSKLYADQAARAHALNAIRAGALRRIATMLALPRGTDTDAIIAATTTAAQVPPQHAHAVLRGAEPTTDAQLVHLANAAAELESRVRTTVGHVERASRADQHRDDTATATYVDPPDDTPPTGAPS